MILSVHLFEIDFICAGTEFLLHTLLLLSCLILQVRIMIGEVLSPCAVFFSLPEAINKVHTKSS
jgi:hypothetical protein